MRPRPVHGSGTVRRATALVLAAMLLVPGLASALPDRPDRWFDDHVYHHYADLTTELQDLQADHPHYISLDSIGTSVMGRSLWTVRITDPSVPAEGKTRIYVDGEHHGNEQLGGELCILLIHHLLEDQGDPLVAQLLASSVVYVTPMLNPDGNTRDQRGNANGIDLNRNYPFAFTPSGSHGQSPASEPEVRANVGFMDGADLDLYVSMHTGIIRLIYPWGYTEAPSPDAAMYVQMQELSESHGVPYGQASTTLYLVDGSSMDYAYGALGIAGLTFEVDGQQTRQITRSEDIATRLSDELALLMELLALAPAMRADLDTTDLSFEDVDGGVRARVGLHNPSMTPANNTTVTLEAYQDGQVVASVSATFDVPAGNDTSARLVLDLDEGGYTLRTWVEYHGLVQENSTVERVLLDDRDWTVEPSLLGGGGGWAVGLLVVLLALGVAVLFWAHRRGAWRPGSVYRRVTSRLGRRSGT